MALRRSQVPVDAEQQTALVLRTGVALSPPVDVGGDELVPGPVDVLAGIGLAVPEDDALAVVVVSHLPVGRQAGEPLVQRGPRRRCARGVRLLHVDLVGEDRAVFSEPLTVPSWS